MFHPLIKKNWENIKLSRDKTELYPNGVCERPINYSTLPKFAAVNIKFCSDPERNFGEEKKGMGLGS